MRPVFLSSIVFAVVAGCATTADGRFESPISSRDVPPGVNPDGDDPFRPSDAGPILVDGSVDVGTWTLPDATVFDQRYAYFWVGAYRAGTTDGAYASAEFRLVQREEDPRCTYTSAGNWDILDCDDIGSAPADPHPLPFPTGGVVTMRGGTTDVSLRPNSQGQYMYFYEEQPVFDGPRRVEVRAAGSPAVPAFAITVGIPGQLELVTPDPGATISIGRDEDFVVTWRPIAARSINMTLTATGQVNDGHRTVRIFADFPAGANRGVIPRRAVQALSRLTVIETLRFQALPQNLTTQSVGAWPVQIISSGRGASASAILR